MLSVAHVLSRSASSVLAGMFDPAGPGAEGAVDLWWLMLALGTLVFVLVGVLLAVALFRRRGADEAADQGPEGSGRPGGGAAMARPWLVGGGVVLPAVGILIVLVATIAAMRASAEEADDGAMVVEVIGHQWWWEVRYPDQGVVTANEIHIPAGEQVVLRLRSADVIHSFWVPALAGKLDLLPEDTNELVIEADEPGRYNGRCAEFCGLQHANMDIFVVAQRGDDFDAWIEDQRRPADEPAGATAATGADIFTSAGCGDCHTIEGTTADGEKGPDLTHLASRETIAAGTLELTTENLQDWVTDPHDAKTGVLMPDPDLDESEVDAVVAYLEGLE